MVLAFSRTTDRTCGHHSRLSAPSLLIAKPADNSYVEHTPEFLTDGALLTEAVAAHRAGDVARAQEMCDTILRVDPRQAEPLHMLGLIAWQRGDLQSARALIEVSLAVQPDVARAHYNLAIVRSLQSDRAGAIVA